MRPFRFRRDPAFDLLERAIDIAIVDHVVEVEHSARLVRVMIRSAARVAVLPGRPE
jgi:hypothetical protein